MTRDNTGADKEHYIKSVLRLKFGARGDMEPSKNIQIALYVAKNFPQLFNNPYFNVHVLALQRISWEKATILRSIYHSTKMKASMPRHYYDMFIMAQKGAADTALQHKELLDIVFKARFLCSQIVKLLMEQL